MPSQPSQFPARATAALADPVLQKALFKLQTEFRRDRAAMLSRMPEFDALRGQARAIKEHVLDHLDTYLEQFEANIIARGGSVHWCRDGSEASDTVRRLCQESGARLVVKSKSMLTEEIDLNRCLEQAGIETVETDLGEYILQLRKEPPSHIVMPAIHLNAAQVGETFRTGHPEEDPGRDLNDRDLLLAEARAKLREKFLQADVGITGANFLIAETGTIVLVTNEGNADLVHSLPRTHIVVAGIEKIVPGLAEAVALIRVLARSATTQEITSYTSFVTGPRREDDIGGPTRFHVVLVDNGRSKLLDGPFRDVLRCIRCGACQSLCPVYGAAGGHAYGSVYGGPIGAVLTPAMVGIAAARHLPEASSLCGQCEEVCPVGIPLPRLLRQWREAAFADPAIPVAGKVWLRLWAFAARRPKLYRPAVRAAVLFLNLMAGRRGRFRRLIFCGSWTEARDLPAPQGGTFVEQWRRRGGPAS
jgi:L-lactate dehydrogenase complex protein LldF